jgi:hypothetical protein
MLPSGPVVMGVKSSCADGAESPISLFKFDIRRSNPSPVKAKVVAILSGSEIEQTTTNSVNNLMQRQAIETDAGAPPIPGLKPEVLLPVKLPGGTNKSYAEHLDDMARFFAKERRGE